MNLRQYKKDNRYTMQDLATAFGVSRVTMHRWVHAPGTEISGRVGDRTITLKKELRREVATEKGDGS